MIKQQRIQQQREDSAALKIAVMPTLDCLPLFVAKETDLFDKDVSDIRLKMFTAQMDWSVEWTATRRLREEAWRVPSLTSCGRNG